MKKITDLYEDPAHATLHSLLNKLPKVKERVKTAEINYDYQEKLPTSAFAWEEKRKFAIDTPENAILSCAYCKYANASEEIPKFVKEKINKALEAYGVEKELFEIDMEKVAAPIKENWLLPEKKRFKIDDAEAVKLAEEILVQKYPELSLEERTEAFKNLYKYASEFKVALSPASNQLGGFTLTSTQMLKEYLSGRQVTTKDPLVKQAYAQLEEGLSNEPQLLYKDKDQFALCEAILKLDKQAGLENEYGKKIVDPILSVYNLKEKKADVLPLDDDFLASKDKINSLPPDFWQDILGEGLGAEIGEGDEMDYEKLHEILPTLPADLKAVIAPYLRDTSIEGLGPAIGEEEE